MLQSYGIYSPYSILIWGMAILLQLYCGVKYFSIGLKQENNKENIILKGFAVYLICWAIAYVFWILTNFQLSLKYDDGIFFGNRENLTLNFIIMDKIGCSLFLIGYRSLFYCFEKIFRNTKFSITIVNIIALIAIILLPNPIYLLFTNFMTLIDIVIFMYIIFLLTKRSRQEFKAVSAMLLLGYAFVVFGTTIHSIQFISLNYFPLILTPLAIIIGNVLFLLPTIISPEKLSKKKYYWYIAFTYAESQSILLIIIYALVGRVGPDVIGLFITSIIMTLFLGIIGFLTIKDVITKQDQLILNDVEVKTTKDILGVFTRPQKITEEEVSISKEKKICLVCKGNVVGI